MEFQCLFILVLLCSLCQFISGCSKEECDADPFPVRVIKEVPTTHGKAGASSSWRNQPWANPENALRQDIKEGWASGIFSSDVRTPLPHLIWYDFPAEKAFIPAEVSFRPRQAGTTLYAPTKWQFVGTNDLTCDEKAAWAILCEDLSGAGYKSQGDIKFCSVSERINRKYRCLGVRILQNGNGVESGLQSLRFWEKIISWIKFTPLSLSKGVHLGVVKIDFSQIKPVTP